MYCSAELSWVSCTIRLPVVAVVGNYSYSHQNAQNPIVWSAAAFKTDKNPSTQSKWRYWNEIYSLF